jgi:8-oxo-dGTP pyrophosphatase MutT (NUDIX family)
VEPTWDDVRRALASRPSEAVTPALASRAAVALILRGGEAGIELLFIRRAEHPRDPWSGQMAFPGGRAEAGDADLMATAVRETAEEIGLDLARSAEPLGALDEVRAMARMRPMDLTIQPFVFRLAGPAELQASAEVRSVHWLPLAALLGADLRSTMDYVHEGTALRFPCVRVDEVVIWGLTYRMLLALGERLSGPTAPGDARAAER